MKTLSCADIGDNNCKYVARGNTDDEVISRMNDHVMKNYPNKVYQINDSYKSKIKEE